ncbi:hypothetical protein PR048_013646 [Dryococelus australis]|uniref:Uncharacterized protein n=1 Tax=Dryococelus australis TaxID=614101 RepID=A0ABQ9HSR9_9NEOP|nr:hypothetical protein PR048_013646 [Dryococelus australis]
MQVATPWSSTSKGNPSSSQFIFAVWEHSEKKKIKFEIGDHIWLYLKMVGTTGNMNLLGHVECASTEERTSADCVAFFAERLRLGSPFCRVKCGLELQEERMTGIFVGARRHSSASKHFRAHIDNSSGLDVGARMEGRWKWEIPEKTCRPMASYSTIPTCEYPVTRPGIEPGSPWWDVSMLIAQPPWPPSLFCRKTRNRLNFITTGRRGVVEKEGGGRGEGAKLDLKSICMDEYLQPGTVCNKFHFVRIVEFVEDGDLESMELGVAMLHDGKFPVGSVRDFCMWESRQTKPLVDGFLGDHSFRPPYLSGAAQYAPRFTLVSSQASMFKSHSNLSTSPFLKNVIDTVSTLNLTPTSGKEVRHSFLSRSTPGQTDWPHLRDHEAEQLPNEIFVLQPTDGQYFGITLGGAQERVKAHPSGDVTLLLTAPVTTASPHYKKSPDNLLKQGSDTPARAYWRGS